HLYLGLPIFNRAIKDVFNQAGTPQLREVSGEKDNVLSDPNAKGREQRGGLPSFKLRRVTELLEAHLDEEFSLDRLAREGGVSEFHFCQLFKKTTGFTPSRYFIRMRMEKARRLLRETTKNVIEVGLDVGYSSPSHFAQIFKREVGIVPSAYRGQV